MPAPVSGPRTAAVREGIRRARPLAAVALAAAVLGAQPGSAADAVVPPAAESDGDARTLYGSAQSDLRDGRIRSGRAKLEAVAAGYPGTLWAKRAREDLVSLMTGSPHAVRRDPLAVERPAAPEPHASAPQPSSLAGDRASPAATVLKPPTWIANAQAALTATVGDRVFFAERSADLGSRAASLTAAQARWVAEYVHGANVLVIGHADDNGTEQEDHELSQARARAVRGMLEANGIPAERLDVEAMGRSQPVAVCRSMSCQAQNRRVEIRLIAGPQAAARTARPPDAGTGRR